MLTKSDLEHTANLIIKAKWTLRCGPQKKTHLRGLRMVDIKAS